MASISVVGTYLPPWGSEWARRAGDDEDAITLAVAAGRAALDDGLRSSIQSIVLITRDLPLVEGDAGAALIAGLGLSVDVPVQLVIGGAPAVLDAIDSARDGVLVIGVDVDGASGASAVHCGVDGAMLTVTGRLVGSMPVVARDTEGHRSDYGDPRLLRELGVNRSLAKLGDPRPDAVAGLSPREASAISVATPPRLPTTGASSLGFALAAMLEQRATGLVLATDQATLTLGELGPGIVRVARDEPPPRSPPHGALAPGAPVSISLAAYGRAFDSKLRLEAGRCRACEASAFPPRYRCLECGAETGSDPVALPRRGDVYSVTTVRVPVPGLISPYTLVLVELGDSGVRTLVRLTGAEPGSVRIGDTGTLVFRLVAVRQGIPDYGYAFLPDRTADAEARGAA